MVDLVTFGETMLRLSPPGQERVETADQYDVHVAGAESNVAVAAQRLGLDSTWVSKLPDSPPGRKVATELRSHGVDTDVVWDDADTGRVGTYYLEQGDVPRGNDVIYDRSGASVTTATVDELPTGLLEETAAFHTSGITPALSERLEATTADLLAAADEAGATTSLDVNYRSKLWTPAEAAEVLTDLFPNVDVLLTAKRDAENLFGLSGPASEMAVELTDEYGFDVTVVTQGAEGAVAATPDEQFDRPAYEASDAHPVGSGDSFVGGFLSQYVEGAPIPRALSWGAATAALKRSVPGDIAVLSSDEVERVMQGDSTEIDR
ncbi:bifunctional 2-dehydro-3-deoxygluconokinase/2-dehydro-3-deoxygalactonokinase [Halomicroarcula sp. GCM10025324]|uniref:bifunctional 2-dehydro-3-deoxygluconokinase/2-dehydro-3- deoxygalactonokinase n=1 Tax=Haloarcula TaxID=2237 RepID=UPI0023E88174|nr:bifunctional 2-dehydro-3-deoxygluconokinase/2-dehydro-3-deoxygalactonokinase [Halomicroarcula sp. ZS-22-S1]